MGLKPNQYDLHTCFMAGIIIYVGQKVLHNERKRTWNLEEISSRPHRLLWRFLSSFYEELMPYYKIPSGKKRWRNPLVCLLSLGYTKTRHRENTKRKLQVISFDLQHENHQLNVNKTKSVCNGDYTFQPFGIYHWDAKLINITKLTYVIWSTTGWRIKISYHDTS